jgi:nucleoside-diphosphate-sugar epimerase
LVLLPGDDGRRRENHDAMKVLVTGGTGFVGSRTAAALIRSGHDVRLLARSPERVVPALAPHAVQIADIVPGDALDPDAVARALEGCDAVVHAAAVYSVDPRRVSEVRDTNETATRIVLGKAVEAGLDPVVHISSTVALTGTMGGGPEMRLGDLSHPYTASKRRSEVIARQFQDQAHLS